jgi:hypothetical protein
LISTAVEGIIIDGIGREMVLYSYPSVGAAK